MAFCLEAETLENTYFRRVILTTKSQQLVLMSVADGIPEETHDISDQFIRVEKGECNAYLTHPGEEMKGYLLRDGDSITIPAGTKHRIVNASSNLLKLYTIYSPPHHPDGTVQKCRPADD